MDNRPFNDLAAMLQHYNDARIELFASWVRFRQTPFPWWRASYEVPHLNGSLVACLAHPIPLDAQAHRLMRRVFHAD